MTDDAAILSVDFLVGFTIFLVSFIWIANLVPGLFLGLSASTIDYNAVAYRTGVILAEDPGATVPTVFTPWEFQTANPLTATTGKNNVVRFGLAKSKSTPGVLDLNKVNSFFNTTLWSYPDDYRTRAVFGDYPYRFNISLRTFNDNMTRFVGDLIPDNYGFIRREVKVAGWSNATIDQTMISNRGYNNTENVTFNLFTIAINSSELNYDNISTPLLDPSRDPAYRIDPEWAEFMINITGLDKSPPRMAPVIRFDDINLSSVAFYRQPYGSSQFIGITPPPWFQCRYYNDGNSTPVTLPVEIKYNVSMVCDPGFFSGVAPDNIIFINMTYGAVDPTGANPNYGIQFLNSSSSGPFQYDYNATNVTQPYLEDGVLEVAVW